MKNQYVGDIGDYGKYGLLRFLANHGIRIGVNWYLTENDGSDDGKFTNYLKDKSERIYDKELFDKLRPFASRKKKTVQMIEDASIIPNAVYYDEYLKSESKEALTEGWTRQQWFDRSMQALEGAELIFADPDNGLTYAKGARNKGSEKYVLPDEVEAYYSSGKDVVYYCHKGRRKQDDWDQAKIKIKEIIEDAQLLGITFHRGTQRSYIFVVHPDRFLRYRQLRDEFLRTEWKGMFSEEEIPDDVVSAVMRPEKVILEVLDIPFSVCRVPDYSDIALDGPYVFTGSTDTEKSLVCPTEIVPANAADREDGWKAFRISGELDFSLIGIVAGIADVLTAEKISIFVISTYNTDYIFVKEKPFEKAMTALKKAGYHIKDIKDV